MSMFQNSKSFSAGTTFSRRPFGGGTGGGVWIQALLGTVAISLVLVLGARQVARMQSTAVWATVSDLELGTVLDTVHVTMVRKPSDEIPEGAVPATTPVHGLTLHGHKKAGQILIRRDLTPPPAAPSKVFLADTVPEGRVLLTVKIGATSIPYPQLKHGDRLDLLAGLRRPGPGPKAEVVAHDAMLIGSIAPRAPKPSASSRRLGMDLTPPRREKKGGSGLHLILAFHPEDVLAVAAAQGADTPFSLVLHGTHEVRAGRLLDYRPVSPGAVDVISGARRETVTLKGLEG